MLTTDFKKNGWLPAEQIPCEVTPWEMFFGDKGILNCGYDSVGNMLEWIYTHTRNDKFDLKPKSSDSREKKKKGVLKKFN